MNSWASKAAKIGAVLAAALPLLASSPSVQAATSTSNMNVKLVFTSNCALSVTDMNFGIVTQVLGTEKATSTVTVNCSTGTFLQLSFHPTFSVANTSKNSTLTSGTGAKINYTMALQGYWGYTGGWTTINGQLAATPGVTAGIYKSVETLYVLY